MRWIISLTAVLLSVNAFGQAVNGTITGIVTDMSGAVVAGATISVRNTDTGFMYQAVSTATGNYTVAQLPTAKYDLQIEAQGFKQFQRQGLVVEPAQVMRVDVQMQIGASSETVTVTAESPLLKTENSAVVTNVNLEQIESLPILPVNGAGTNPITNGLRDPWAVISTVPGTTYVAGSFSTTNGNSAMNILIEGMTGNMPSNVYGANTYQSQPSADAIQEVAVLTSNYSAEYGMISGGVLNVTMRSGTNRFHGGAYAYGVNEALNAAQPFSGVKNIQRRYDFGGTFGGPVRLGKLYNGANKTFFFLAYEEFLTNSTINSVFATVPLAPYRMGDFSQLIPLSGNQNVKVGGSNFVDPLGQTILSGTLFDPNSTRTVACDKIAFPTATCAAGTLVADADSAFEQPDFPDFFRSGGCENPKSGPPAARPHREYPTELQLPAWFSLHGGHLPSFHQV